mgnify:FL=1
MIFADDLGFSDLGCYGANIVETPNLDRMGFGGMRFTQFYNNAKCAPSRASLLTGLYSQQVGCQGPPVAMRDCVTTGEALRLAGYQTWYSGKWHAEETPYQRGFDRAWGLCDGHCNYFNPGPARVPGDPDPAFWGASPQKPYPRWADNDREIIGWTPDDPDFYTTDAFTDRAITYLQEAAGDDRPFYLHLCYTAPHFPLQARDEDIAKYRGRFKGGWDEMRRRRHERQLELGIVDARWKLPARDEPVPAWEDATDPDEQDHLMAVYAAMIDRMDQNIGRLRQAVDERGETENTLILFMSDNGGSSEDFQHTPDTPPGGIDSFRFVGANWANASNTPFRKFKSWDHEGGVSTPGIAYWPGVIPAGTLNHDVAHLIDVMPTLLELAGSAYPQTYDGRNVTPCEGRTLLPLFEGRSREPHPQLGWQFWNWAALREGDWKIVRRAKDAPWELYDMAADRTETNDLAALHPDIVERLAAGHVAWAEHVGAKR